ncbi:stAR-related lipid transfer protein 5-like [Anneissia japonica]|uniref:stAR-related lipid transfer protein 5-like n=1 Tax=Anneissia japonica TaxID=1529436 RepID=UPI00142563C6|nr:stAR-related lipid transfer protein 5-like [Anneissia japonica]XP_033112449.1 stAR-related lipid transfer protein 5-like [Anneissia japonica]XP_033112450.1 stAR-related lipid transfer protein 5-like [Anneissia japonica]
METTIDFCELAEVLSNRVLEYYHEEDWKPLKDEDNITVMCKKSRDFSGNVYRGDCTIPLEPEKALSYFLPHPHGRRQKWDSSVAECQVLIEVTKDITISKVSATKLLQGLISDRDFIHLDVVKRFPELGFTCVNSCSIDHKDYPPGDDYVRGTTHPSGFFLKKHNKDRYKTNLTYIAQAEANGRIPRYLTEAATGSHIIGVFKDMINDIESTKV